MGNCLVTKLKGTVDNPNLRYYGEFRIYAKNLTGNNNTSFAIVPGSSVHYKAIGIDSLTINSAPAEMEGVLTANSTITILAASDGGYVRFWSKYDGLKDLMIGRGVSFDYEDLYAVSDLIKIGVDSLYVGWEHLDKPIELYAYQSASNKTLTIPLIKDMQGYKNIKIAQDEYYPFDRISFDHDLDVANYFGASGDLNNVLNVEGLSDNLDKLYNFRVYENNCYISNIEAFADCVNLNSFTTHMSAIGGDVINTVKNWTNLNMLVIAERNSTREWKPLFDAWKATVRSRTITVYLTGTYDGTSISNKHSLVYDANGDYTLS